MLRGGKINGVEILNARARLEFTVTPADIKSANVKKPGQCAVAKALKREHGVKEAFVHLTRVYLKVGANWRRYEVDRALQSEIITFDRGGRFQAGDYALRKPTSTKPAASSRSGNNGKHAKETRPRHVTLGVRSGPSCEVQEDGTRPES